MIQSRVYIILVNYNGWSDTIECLESLLKTADVDFRIIIVDNCSNDNSVENIDSWSKGYIQAGYSNNQCIYSLTNPNVVKPIDLSIINFASSFSDDIKLVLIKSNSNGGFSAGNNIGIRYALSDKKCNYVWLLNNDTIVFPDSLRKLLYYHITEGKNDKLGIIGNRLAHYSKPLIQQAYAGKLSKWTGSTRHIGENDSILSCKEHFINYDYPIGASLLVPVEFIHDVGLMDENYFLYFEELDWVLRGKKKGWSAKVDPNTYIYHKQGNSTGNNDALFRSLFADKNAIQSKIYFFKKHFPFMLIIVIATFPIIIFNRIKRNQTDRILELLKSLFLGLAKKNKSV